MSNLKDFVLITDRYTEFMVWTKSQWQNYEKLRERAPESEKATFTCRAITTFDADEELKDTPKEDWPEAFKKEPVTFLLVNALKYLTPEQQRQLRDALIERTPKEDDWVKVEEFAKWLDEIRNTNHALWKNTKIWGTTTAYQSVFEVFKALPSPPKTDKQ